MSVSTMDADCVYNLKLTHRTAVDDCGCPCDCIWLEMPRGTLDTHTHSGCGAISACVILEMDRDGRVSVSDGVGSDVRCRLHGGRGLAAHLPNHRQLPSVPPTQTVALRLPLHEPAERCEFIRSPTGWFCSSVDHHIRTNSCVTLVLLNNTTLQKASCCVVFWWKKKPIIDLTTDDTKQDKHHQIHGLKTPCLSCRNHSLFVGAVFLSLLRCVN